MNSQLAVVAGDVSLTGDVRVDMVALLTRHDQGKIAGHSMRVAAESKRLAEKWGVDADGAETAGWLHDISAIVSTDQRIGLAEGLQIDILPEERAYAMIIHQKLSAFIAGDLFAITSPAILSAIGCHTTLKKDASLLDKIVFIADKLKWDQEGDPPYITAMVAAVEHSLDGAAFCYLEYLWEHRASLPVLHPWARDAYHQLKEQGTWKGEGMRGSI